MKLSKAAARLPVTSGGGPSSDPSPPTPKHVSIEFWRAFVKDQDDLCRDALRRLEDMKGGSVFSFDELSELSQPTTGGAYSPAVVLPPGTPKTTIDHWNSPKATRLKRVVPGEHCLALIGDVTKENDQCFVACAQLRKGSGSPDECTYNTHSDIPRP